jgi:parallel beta-helix repeat protein
MHENRKHLSFLTIIFIILLGISNVTFDNSSVSELIYYNEDNINFQKDLRISINHQPIFIDGNHYFNQTAFNNGWNGNGSYNNPYIIENYTIYAINNEPGIEIRNTNVYFIINNVSIFDGRSNYNLGFLFSNITNGYILNNTADNNIAGFFLKNSNNNTFEGNTATNGLDGFQVQNSVNNSFHNNIANYNSECGIYLDNSGNISVGSNTLLNNTAENNLINGFFLKHTENTTLIGNTANNNTEGGFYLDFSINTTIFNNTANNNLESGFHLNSSDNNVLTNNIAKLNSMHGIYLNSSNNNTVIENSIPDNGLASIKEDNCEDNIIKFNFYGVEYVTILIDGNEQLNATATLGSGTKGDPLLIENYEIDASFQHGIEIRNTDLFFIISSLNVSNGGSNYYGFYLSNVTNGELRNNKACNNRHAIYIEDSHDNIFVDNVVTNNINGFLLNGSYNNTLMGNVVSDNRHGFSLQSSYNNSITDNTVSDNIYLGFYLENSSHNVLTDNTATRNLNGFTLSSSNNNNFTGNSANNNGNHGWYLLESNSNLLTNNIANNNDKYGIYLEDSIVNVISDNVLENNGLGDIHFKTEQTEQYPDIFLIASIIAIIAFVGVIIIKSRNFIKKFLMNNEQ